jgi:hypothetical protein
VADVERTKVVAISDKSTSCFSWTPRQMLQAFINAIDAGEEVPAGMVVIYTEVKPDKSTSVHSWRAQVSWVEEYTYLEVAQQKCLDTQRR